MMLIEVRQLVWQPLRFGSSEVESDAAFYYCMDPMVFLDSTCGGWKIFGDVPMKVMQKRDKDNRRIRCHNEQRFSIETNRRSFLLQLYGSSLLHDTYESIMT